MAAKKSEKVTRKKRWGGDEIYGKKGKKSWKNTGKNQEFNQERQPEEKAFHVRNIPRNI